MTVEGNDDHDRLIRVESELGHQAHEFAEHLISQHNDRDTDRSEMRNFREEVRRSLDAVNARLIGFALTVAGSALAVALTVYFTRS